MDSLNCGKITFDLSDDGELQTIIILIANMKPGIA